MSIAIDLVISCIHCGKNVAKEKYIKGHPNECLSCLKEKEIL